jgi:transposase
VPCYPTDLSDGQWAVLEPLLPVMLCLTILGGRPEKHWRRTMIDAMFYVADNGCKWRALPKDFPPWQTVHAMFARWKRDGVWADVTDLVRARVRTAEGRDPEPSAAVIDSQSVHESAEGVVPSATSGFDSWKRVNGRKRHLLVDTLGLLIAVAVTKASTPDRDTAPVLLARARRRGRRRLALVWAGNACHGGYQDWTRRELGIIVETAGPLALGQGRKGQGFQVLHIPGLVARRAMLVMTEMLSHLLVQRRFQHRLGQLLQQPIGAGQRHTLLPGPGHQLLRQLLPRRRPRIILPLRHSL